MYKQVKQITDMHMYSNPESGYERGFNEGVEVAMRVICMQEAGNPWHIVDIEIPKQEIDELTNKLDNVTKEMGLKVHVMHEDIFNSMHKI